MNNVGCPNNCQLPIVHCQFFPPFPTVSLVGKFFNQRVLRTAVFCNFGMDGAVLGGIGFSCKMYQYKMTDLVEMCKIHEKVCCYGNENAE